MELRIYLAIVRKWLWLIVICTVISGGIAYFFSRQKLPVYQATTQLIINEGNSQANDYSAILRAQRLTATFAERLINPTVQKEVMETLGLEAWTAQVNITTIRDTPLLTLSVQENDPELAMQIANLIPEVFVRQNRVALQEEFDNSEELLTGELEKLRTDIDATQAAINELEEESEANLAQLERLKGDLNEYQTSYTFFSRNYQDLRLAQVQMFNPIRIDQAAELPLFPIGPNVWRDTLLAAILGAMVGLGAAFFIEYLDDTIKPTMDLKSMFGLGTLALIGRMEEKEERVLVHTLSKRSATSEAYRMLRANIRFASIDEPLRSFVVTSPKPSEGKSTTAANLAVVMAQEGNHTLLIDADLRKPVQHKIFNITRNTGLTTALVDREKPVAQYLQETEIKGLRLLPAGPIPPNPSELLGSKRMRELLNELQEEADIIIIDSAPVLAVADTSLLTSAANGVLLVLRANSTNFDATQGALEQLAGAQANVIGAVLNDVDASDGGYYYYYYSSYYGTPSDPDGPSGARSKPRKAKPSFTGKIRTLLFNTFSK